jgi:DNA replication protein DnaC
METISEKIAAWKERCAARAEDPAYKANAERWRETKAEAAQRENDRRLALLDAGVPMAIWDAIREPKETDALVAAREFLASPPACTYLVLAGPAGRGKTFAAGWAVAERGGRYAIAHDLVTAGTFDAALWRDLASVGLLALDELGSEYRNAAFEASLYSLLNSRHAHGRKTILCTNLDGEAFVARYCPKAGDPLRDRLRTAQAWAPLPGESMRKHWTDDERRSEEER